MEVELLHNTPLHIASKAIRTAWQSFDKSDNGGQKDKELIDRVGNKFKHSSTLEHLVYTFYIKGISRALLQELARHRIASLTVKSTRYTLKELKEEKIKWFNIAGEVTDEAYNLVEKYCVLPKDLDFEDEVKFKIALANSLGTIANSKLSNDRIKYLLPESYKTELTYTINARSLQNFLSLRSDKSALWEIRILARKLYEALPNEHKYLFGDCMKDIKRT